MLVVVASNVRRQPADAGPGRHTELRSPVIASNSNVRRQPAHAGPGLMILVVIVVLVVKLVVRVVVVVTLVVVYCSTIIQ